MNPISHKTGFQQRVVVAILAVGVVSVALGLISVYFLGRASLEKSIGSTYQNLAEVTAGNLEKEVRWNLNEARTLALSRDLVRVVSDSNQTYAGSSPEDTARQLAAVESRWANDQGVDAYLHALLTNPGTAFLREFANQEEGGPTRVQILVADAHGAVVAATNKPGHFDFSKQDWWRTVMETGLPYLSDIEAVGDGERYTFSVAQPIRKDSSSKPIGVLYMSNEAGEFFRLVTDVKVGQTDHTMLVSSGGLILFCPVLPIKSHNLSPLLQSLVLKQQSGWVTSTEDVHYPGRRSINGFAPVSITFTADPHNFGGKHWYIVTSQDPKETFAPILGLLKWVALTGVLGALVIAFLGFVVARRIIRPIHALREGVERVAAGDLDYTISVHTGDEIEDLATSFNHMGEKLKASYSGLEAKISERTRELEAKNRELFALYAIASTLNQVSRTQSGFLDALNKIIVTVHTDAIALSVFGEAGKPDTYTAPKGALEEKPARAALATLEEHVRKENSPLVVADLRGNAHFNLLERDLGYLGVASMPISVKSQMLGVLHFLTREPRQYSATERTLISSIVNQLGVSIENARLSKEQV